MVKKSRIDDTQETMPGIDTDLSIAADKFLSADETIHKAKASKDDAELELIELMKAKGKNTITHNGRTLTARKGHITKGSITVK